jgi:hypothetical protein
MKHALIKASGLAFVAGIGVACAWGMNERWAPATALEQRASGGQTDLQKFTAPQIAEKAKPAPTAQAPETTGLGSPVVGQSSTQGAADAAGEKSGFEAEVRRVRAAVDQTLSRTRESFGTASARRVRAAVDQTLRRTQELFRTAAD